MGPDEGGELQELPTGLSRAVHTLLRKLSQTLLKMLSLLILINKDLAHYFLPCPLHGFPVVKLSVVFFQLCHMAGGSLVPRPGVDPAAQQCRCVGLAPEPPGNSPNHHFSFAK